MKPRNRVFEISIAAILIAWAIIIPMYSPLKIVFLATGASYTLFSHVPIFIGIFISPWVGIATEIGATLGFFLGGMPPAVVARAGSQLIFVIIGGLWIYRQRSILDSRRGIVTLGIILSIIHAFFEVVAVVLVLGLSNTVFTTVLLFVGLGTFVHSCFDYGISVFLYKKVLARLRKS